jgi:hypothetical protein
VQEDGVAAGVDGGDAREGAEVRGETQGVTWMVLPTRDLISVVPSATTRPRAIRMIRSA